MLRGDRFSQRIKIKCLPFTRYYECFRYFACFRVGYAGDAAIGNVGVLQQHCFEFSGRDAETLVLNHLLLAINDVDIALIIDPADVARMQPAFAQSLCSLFRGRGFGKKILQAAVAAAWQADCYKVMLMTGSKKASTLAFYGAAGFEQNKTGFQVRRIAPRAEASD